MDKLAYGILWSGLALIELLHWFSDQWCKMFHNDPIKQVYVSLDDNIPDKITWQCNICSRKWED